MSGQSPLRISLANKADAEKLTTLINLAFAKVEGFFVDEDRIDVSGVKEFLEAGEFLVAEHNDTVAGCVYLEHRGERTYLGLLSVDPAHQNKGIGSLLMTAAEERCRGRNSNFIDINIVNLREELPLFYQKRGYVITGSSAFPADIRTKLPCHFINMSKRIAE